jgi:hypothetical protein
MEYSQIGFVLFLEICLPTILMNIYFLIVSLLSGREISGDSHALASILVLDVTFFLFFPWKVFFPFFLIIFWFAFIFLLVIFVRVPYEYFVSGGNELVEVRSDE